MNIYHFRHGLIDLEIHRMHPKGKICGISILTFKIFLDSKGIKDKL